MRLNRIVLLVVFTCLITNFVFAQPKFEAKNLSIVWEPVKNDTPKPGQSLNAITITNNGKSTLPASGWKLYFNSARLIASATVSGNAKIDFINGDLFSLTPTDSFTALNPKASIRIEFTDEEPVVNITDGPEGFYLVWDDEPEKGYNTGTLTIKPFKPEYPGLVTPAMIYEQNKNIPNIPESQLTRVFPSPVSYKETGGVFVLDNKTNISADASFIAERQQLTLAVDELTGIKSNSKQAPSGKGIKLHKIDGLGSEGYELKVTAAGIDINASTTAGAFYGIQSLKTLLPPLAFQKPSKSIQVPCVEVKDEPRFAYRGFMVDVGRNFQPKSEILKVLDAMALYKLNVFHFHITDDEGWRLQIQALPELTDVGAVRAHTTDSKLHLPPSHGSGGEPGKTPGSGFYTRQDYIDILRYATARHITVITEIETPGHARAAVKAMNHRYNGLMAEGKKAEAEHFLLADPNDKSVYSTSQYWNDNVIDVSLPSTYNFFTVIIDELAGIYKEAGAPLISIHFGGDEVPAHVWEQSPAYLNLKAARPEIKNTGDLWYYFYGNMNTLLHARGLTLAGWEEMGLRKTALDGASFYVPNPDFSPYHLQAEVWNNTLGDGNEDLAYKLANAGYKVVLSCVTNLYFDMANYKSFDEPGYYWGAFADLDKPYSFIPFDYFKNSKVDKNGLPINRNIFIGKQRLTDYGKTNIIGIQGAIWGENIKTTERLEYMVFPRLLGLAERAWSKDPNWATEKDAAKSDELYNTAWDNFLNVLSKRELPRLDYYHNGYHYRLPKPGVTLQDGKYVANEQFPGLVIRYTTDGKEPDNKSKIYNDAVTSSDKGLKFRAFDTKGRGSNVAEPVN